MIMGDELIALYRWIPETDLRCCSVRKLCSKAFSSASERLGYPSGGCRFGPMASPKLPPDRVKTVGG